MNGNQPRLTRFVNQTEMSSFSGMLRGIAWFVVIIGFAGTACILMLRGEERDGVSWVSWGLQLAIAVLGGLAAASGIGAVNTKTIRGSSREALEGQANIEEAKARGKAQGEVLTAERPSLPPLVAHADKVEQQVVPVPPAAGYSDALPDEPEWADGEPRRGIL